MVQDQRNSKIEWSYWLRSKFLTQGIYIRVYFHGMKKWGGGNMTSLSHQIWVVHMSILKTPLMIWETNLQAWIQDQRNSTFEQPYWSRTQLWTKKFTLESNPKVWKYGVHWCGIHFPMIPTQENNPSLRNQLSRLGLCSSPKVRPLTLGRPRGSIYRHIDRFCEPYSQVFKPQREILTSLVIVV